MSLRIRLARGGAKKRPFYRIVVAEATSPRDGRFVEKVGTYNPMLPKDHADRVILNGERIKHWLGVGALPTDRLHKLLGQAETGSASCKARVCPYVSISVVAVSLKKKKNKKLK